MNVIREAVAVTSDRRGVVLEPLGVEHLPRQRNTHLVVTRPGCIRGNHLHRTATEILVVLGPALVRYREEGSVEEVRIPDGEAVRFTFPPGIPHAIQHTGDKPGILIAFTDTVHNPDAPDAVPEVLIGL